MNLEEYTTRELNNLVKSITLSLGGHAHPNQISELEESRETISRILQLRAVKVSQIAEGLNDNDIENLLKKYAK